MRDTVKIVFVMGLFVFTGCMGHTIPEEVVIEDVGLNEEKNELSVRAEGNGEMSVLLRPPDKANYRLETFERNCNSKDDSVGAYTIDRDSLEADKIYRYDISDNVDYVQITRLPGEYVNKKMWSYYGRVNKCE
jgi:hypothetical protein